MNNWQTFTKGFFKENPTFVLLLGMCPTLGVTTSAINGLGMGLATAFVLVLSNLAISLVANLIPDKIRIPGFIVIIAAFVTVVDMCMAAYLPSLHESLGLFIPLIEERQSAAAWCGGLHLVSAARKASSAGRELTDRRAAEQSVR